MVHRHDQIAIMAALAIISAVANRTIGQTGISLKSVTEYESGGVYFRFDCLNLVAGIATGLGMTRVTTALGSVRNLATMHP